MIKTVLAAAFLFFNVINTSAQSIRLKGLSDSDSVLKDSLQSAYLLSAKSIKRAFEVNRDKFYSDKKLVDNAIDLWNQDTLLLMWFGKVEEHSEVKMILGRIKKLNKKAQKKVILKIHNKNSGLCKGTRHAWTIPYGKVKIHLCNQFTYKSYRHWVKIFIHELGHETGILFHRDIYWYSAALRAARDNPWKARRNPENYAYYILFLNNW